MSRHIWAVLNYFSIAALSTVLVFISPGVAPAAGPVDKGNLPVAAKSARGGSCTSSASAKVKSRVSEMYGRLPLYFTANRGQVNGKTLFYETGFGHATFFTRKGLVLGLRKADGQLNRKRSESERRRARRERSPAEKVAAASAAQLEIGMAGMNKDVQIVPEDTQRGTVNCFIGSDPRKWHTNIPTYGAVLYKDAYPGVDIKFHGNNRRLEYDIIVKPGADPSRVRFQYSGAKDVHVTDAGDLAIELKDGRLLQKKPCIYQEINGRRVLRQGKFEVREDKSAGGVLNTFDKAGPHGAKLGAFTCRFDLGAYDRKVPLVIDPVLVYSTYLGGNGADEAYSIAVDGNGNAYVAGLTLSTNFPNDNAIRTKFAGGATYGDAFVTEIAAGGKSLVYSTYLGGSGDDQAHGIAVDTAGNAYVTGWTDSSDFPTTQSAFQPTPKGGEDAFVAEIAAGGASLVYSTYLGGSGDDYGDQIAVDSSGNAYVAGSTTSSDFPVRNALYSSLAGGEDAFVAEIAAGGKTLVYSTYLGGSEDDEAWGIAVDSSGNAYVAGWTRSDNFPSLNAIQPKYAGGTNHSDAFVTEIAAGGQSLVFSTYLGGSGDDMAYSIALDSSGNAYVAGSTESTDFPIKNAFQSAYGGPASDAFVAEIAAGGKSLVYSTYLGGSEEDWANGIAVDGPGNAYVAGITLSTNFPVANAIQPANGGAHDAFVTEIAAGGKSLVYSTYLGGSGDDAALSIAVDIVGNAYVAGSTKSTNFPTASGFQSAFAGGQDDAFTAEIGGLWSNAVNLGGGWYWLSWFGYFNTNAAPWIYHPTLGWLYPYGSSTDSIWFWDTGMNAFWWTSATVYPYIWRASDGVWLYYDVGSSSPRWFYNYGAQKWESY